MSAYKTYIQRTLIKKYHCDEPEIITFYVKHISVIANVIYIVKCLFYICEFIPISSFCKYYTMCLMMTQMLDVFLQNPKAFF